MHGGTACQHNGSSRPPQADCLKRIEKCDRGLNRPKETCGSLS